MTTVDPFAAAVAVATVAQGDLRRGRVLLGEYLDDGLDPAHLAWGACQLLAIADDDYTTAATGYSRGEWLRQKALRVARRPDPSD